MNFEKYYPGNIDDLPGSDDEYARLIKFAEEADEFWEVEGAYILLLCRGEQGFIEIQKIGARARKNKHLSNALRMFAFLSEKKNLEDFHWLGAGTRIVQLANQGMSNIDSQIIAFRSLLFLVREAEEFYLGIAASTALTGLTLLVDKDGSQDLTGRPLIDALASKWIKISKADLDSYRELLVAFPNDESVFHTFFEKFPQFLDPLAIKVWSKPDFFGHIEPDFLVLRSDGEYVIVEIEKPSKMLVTKRGQHSADVTQAEMQVIEAKAFLNDRMLEARVCFPGYKSPRLLTVIGMESELDAHQKIALERINDSRSRNSEIIGFDVLGNRIERILSNFSSGEIEVVTGFRFGANKQ